MLPAPGYVPQSRPSQRLIWTDYRSWSTNSNSPTGTARGGPLDADDDIEMRNHGTVVERMQGATPVGETAVVMSETLSGSYSQAKATWTLPTPHVRPGGSTIATTPIPILGGVRNVANGVAGSAAAPVPSSAASLPATDSYAVHSLGAVLPLGEFPGLGGYRWTQSTQGWLMLNNEQNGLWWDIIGQVNGHEWLGDAAVDAGVRAHVRGAAIDTIRWHATRLRSAFPAARVGNYGFPVLRPSDMISADPARRASQLHWTLPGSPLTSSESSWLDSQAALWAPACEPYNLLIPVTRPLYWSSDGNGVNYDRGYRRAAIELAVRVRRLLGRDRRSMPIVPSTSLLFHESELGSVSSPFDASGNLTWTTKSGRRWVPEPPATTGTTRLLGFREHVVGEALDAGADGVWLTFGWDETYLKALEPGTSTEIAYARHRLTLDHDLIARRGAPDIGAMMQAVRDAGLSTWGAGNLPSEVAYRDWWSSSSNRGLVASDVAIDALARSASASQEMIRRSTRGMARRATVVSLMSATGPSQPGQGGGG